MEIHSVLKISDDSGFLGIVNASKYNSYIGEDWQLSQLFERFIAEMRNGSLIFWATGSENIWTVSFVERPSEVTSFREFTWPLEITDRRFYLINFEILAMAAQYNDHGVPSQCYSDHIVELDNGKYEFLIRQMFDPSDESYNPFGRVNFEIVIKKDEIQSQSKVIDEVFWRT